MSVKNLGSLRRWIATVLVLIVCVVSDPRSNGVTAGTVAQTDSTTWTIDEVKMFTAEKTPISPEIDLLLLKLKQKKGGGAPVSRKEFIAMLHRPEAKTVYTVSLMRYATPLSMDEQARFHTSYTKRLLTEENLQACVDFMRKEHTLLRRAEKKFHVAQQDIVSILTWESGLGKNAGTYRIFNVYLGQILFLDEAQKLAVSRIVAKGAPNPLSDSTIAAREMRRMAARKLDAVNSLAALLRYAKKMKFDPLTVLGSWGGAMGYVQFMPYNIKYAIDADGNGLNLQTWPDAIFSVANFLKKQGNYKPDSTSRRRAILRYNYSQEYADGVIALADTIWQRYQHPK
jgi:membrane-bound lytic murein transglycosylase B